MDRQRPYKKREYCQGRQINDKGVEKMGKRVIVNLGRVLCLSVLTFLSGCCINVADVFKAKSKRTEHKSVPVADITELRVEGEVGSITITGADVTDCSITAEITVKARTKEKARQLAEQVEIETDRSDGKLNVKATKPAALKSHSLVVDFRITAPRPLNLDCTTHVGGISISDIEGQIEASADVGSIICSRVLTDLKLEVNVGSVKVGYVETAPAACNADIVTNVGSIEFAGPPHLSVQLDARTNVGSIKTSKPITVVGKVGKSLKGTIGSGEGRVHLKTNIGSIEIK
jgi:hypothetical protein